MKNSILITILIIAAFLRLWNLSSYPSGFNADEASIGYNAYSLIQTGKDEYGTPFPLVFKSFGDYKPGLYFYFVVPFVYLLGLTELAVRLPSALFGIATVYIIYLLGRKIFRSEGSGFLVALLLAISPWQLHFSRGGWESNAATFFITVGFWLFLESLERPKLFILSGLSFLVSMYLYQSPRLIVPILVLGLLVIYRKKFINKFKSYIFTIPIIILLSIPLGLQFIGGAGSTRFSGLSFYSDSGPGSRSNELRGEHSNNNGISSKILHNRIIAYAPNLLGHYLDHFSTQFLFINGEDVIRNKVPETGEFFLFSSIFLISGLIFLFYTKLDHKMALILWLLIAPLASSLTFQTPNALRSLNMVIPLTLIMGFGLWKLINQFKKLKKVIAVITIICLIFELGHYLESYYIHYPKRSPLAWEYGFKEMVGKLIKYEEDYKQVIITDRYDQPYILVLFYKKYDPRLYQPQAKLTSRDKFNFGTVTSFDKYSFRTVKPKEIVASEKTLFIVTKKEVPKDAKIIDEVLFPNGDPAFIFIKT